jgi:hypothetical protein
VTATGNVKITGAGNGLVFPDASKLTTADRLKALCGVLGYADLFFCKAALGVLKIVFLTNGYWNGNLGGIDGANAKCQAEATAAGLPGSYVAWLSSSTRNPAASLAKGGPWFATDKSSLIAANWAQVQSGHLTTLITLNASGGQPFPLAWTGTNPDGTPTTVNTNQTCNDWTGTGGSGYDVFAGYLDYPTLDSCVNAYGLYCFQQ